MSAGNEAARRLETVHLVRHAHAGDPAKWNGPDDLRPLSEKGRRQAERLGRFLVRAGVRPDQLISSPKIRARQTAEILGGILGLNVDTDDRLAAGCTLDRLDALLAGVDARAPMVVGHDPDFSGLLSTLIGAAAQEMKKGALATVEVRRPLRAGEGLLRWLVPPDVLTGSDEPVIAFGDAR